MHRTPARDRITESDDDQWLAIGLPADFGDDRSYGNHALTWRQAFAATRVGVRHECLIRLIEHGIAAEHIDTVKHVDADHEILWVWWVVRPGSTPRWQTTPRDSGCWP